MATATVQITNTPSLLEKAVQQAVSLLRAGEVVALPTETVYGLAANALDARAVEKIYTMKGRPAHNPIIVHVASVPMARDCTAGWGELADKLAVAFWPGPLTLVLPKAASIPDIVTAGGATVAVRWPNHPVIQAVIERAGFPLAAPSANLSGQVSPTTAEHVRRALGDRLALIVDGGPAEVGIESTVLDLSLSPPRILRPGIIHEESLAAVVGPLAAPGGHGEEVLRSPGLLPKHYSPKARLVIWEGRDADKLRSVSTALSQSPGHVHFFMFSGRKVDLGPGRVCAMPREPLAYAKALYAELHRADEAGADLIVVEAVPRGLEWRGVADRLRRAAA